MAADINLAEYNPVAQALLTPFDESEISEREGSNGKTFSFVPPERYRYRLLQVFGNGHLLHITDAVPGKLGVQAQAHFIGEVPEEGVRYDIKAPCFEPWSFTKEGKIFAPEQTFQKLISAGLKACAGREIGLGLHLYDKAARRVTTTASKTAAAKSAPAATAGVGSGEGIPNFDPEWDGTEKITFGTKYKGREWTEAEDDYLAFITADPDKANKKALKEIARRQSVAGQSGNSSAAAAMADAEPADDAEFAF